jgi:HEAT repeat protein
MPALLKALRRQDRQVLFAASAVIGVDAPLAKVALALAEDTRRRNLCIGLGSALGMMGDPAVPHITQGLRDPNSSVRLGAVWAVSVRAREAADTVPALVDLFRDSDPEVQVAASSALARIGKPAVPALAAKLKDKDPRVRSLAANTLTRLPILYPEDLVSKEGLRRMRAKAREEAVPALVGALNDSSAEVRLYAAEALIVFPEQRPHVMATLDDLIKSSVPYVSQRAGALRGSINPGPDQPAVKD